MQIVTTQHLEAIIRLLLHSPKYAMKRIAFQKIIHPHPKSSFAYRMVSNLLKEGYFLEHPMGETTLYRLNKEKLFLTLSQEPFFEPFLEMLQDQGEVILL